MRTNGRSGWSLFIIFKRGCVKLRFLLRIVYEIEPPGNSFNFILTRDKSFTMPSFATVGFEAPKTVMLPHTSDSLAIDSVNQAIAELSAETIGMAVRPASISSLPPEIRDMIGELVPPIPRLITVTWSKDAVIVPQRQSNGTYWGAKINANVPALMHVDHVSRACYQRHFREDYTITLNDQFGRSICIDPIKDYLHFKGYRAIETLDKWIEDVEKPSDMKLLYKNIHRIVYTAPTAGKSGEASVIFSLLRKYVFLKEIVVLGNGAYDQDGRLLVWVGF